MTTNTATHDRTMRKAQPFTQSTGPMSGALYRFHGFNVFDSNGERVGIVDWIWTNATTGEGDHIGLQLQWLRGRARAVPAAGVLVDRELEMVRLPVTKRQISRALRFRIDRALSRADRGAIADYFTPSISEAGSSFPAPLAA